MITVEKEVYEAVLRNSVKVADLEAENQQLKDLLKECREFVGLAGYLSLDNADDNTTEQCNKLLTKINEVLK